MIRVVHGRGGDRWKAIALTVCVWITEGTTVMAFQDGMAAPLPNGPLATVGAALPPAAEQGTLGYGPPGLFAGFQGFGLGYHTGYGYGGQGLGVGSGGGYPLYGGPGYPHPWPQLNRCGGISPFYYFGGPGYPSPDHPHFFGGTGPLVSDEPVITIADGRPDPGYGTFSGGTPDPEGQFAPFTAEAAAAGTASGVITPVSPVPSSMPPAPGSMPPASMPAPVPNLPGPSVGISPGIDTVAIVDTDGSPALQISQVSPGSAAEKAGLHTGDVIRSINGYVTKMSGNVPWIIENAAPHNILRLSVRTSGDGKLHPITVTLH